MELKGLEQQRVVYWKDIQLYEMHPTKIWKVIEIELIK